MELNFSNLIFQKSSTDQQGYVFFCTFLLDKENVVLVLLHTQSIAFATLDSQCLEYLGCITLGRYSLSTQET